MLSGSAATAVSGTGSPTFTVRRRAPNTSSVGGDFGSLRDELRTNVPPTLEVFGARRRTVKVGEPVPLTAVAADPDNKGIKGQLDKLIEEFSKKAPR